jgi:hypothetical protein
MKIRVTKRTDDYHACLDECSACWVSGRTIDQAVYKLLISHPKIFDIEIEVIT